MRNKIWNSLVIVLALLLAPGAVFAQNVPSFDFATPLFGLAVAPDGSLLAADSGSGIVELRQGQGDLVMSLPGVVDIAPLGRGEMFALTGAGEGEYAWKLFRVSRGNLRPIADLLAFETAVNPDGGEIDSNPFDVAALNGGKALVADAGGNSLLIVDLQGNIDWVAMLPMQLAPTGNLKTLLGCPSPPQGLEFACFLPDEIPAEAVATSVAVGPDGAYYVGELTGFPSPRGLSRIWRIEPGTLHAECGVSPACQVVFEGFTSIVDLNFGPDGRLYVVEFDEASFLAAELVSFGLPPALEGGTINACDLATKECQEIATELMLPIAAAVDRNGTIFAAIGSLIPGAAQVIALP